MKLTIRAEGLTLDQTTRARAERRLAFALGRFAERIDSVRLVVADENGPRGGVDKLCKLNVHGRGWDVHVEDADAVVDTAVDRVAGRAGRSVARKLARLRQRAA